MNKQEEKFTAVFNVFFDSRELSNEYNINAEELMVYYALFNQKNFLRDESRISIEFLLEYLNKKNTKANREKAEKSIETLSLKGIINIHQKDKISVTVSFNQLHNYEHILSDDIGYIKGFERMYVVELDELLRLTNYNQNAIYLYTLIKAKETEKRAVELGYSVLADIMQVSSRTVINTVNKLKELNLITVTVSKKKVDYNEVNAYRHVSIVDSIQTEKLENRESDKPSTEEIENMIEQEEAYQELLTSGEIDFEEDEEDEEEVSEIEQVDEDGGFFMKKVKENKDNSKLVVDINEAKDEMTKEIEKMKTQQEKEREERAKRAKRARKADEKLKALNINF